MGRTEGDVEGRLDERWGKKDGVRRDERVGDLLSQRETRMERESERERRNGDGENTCSERVHAFQGFRESGGI